MQRKAIVLREHGAPDVLRPGHVDVGTPAAGELLIRHSAVGVNFHDCYVRSGLYRTLALPGIPGIEAAGEVESVGAGVQDFAVGDRVVWISGAYGGYAEARTLSARLAVKIPESITDAQAAASFMKATTACMLVRKVHAVAAGQTVLVHAAAGGVGQLLSSWARHLGARVIGTVGDDAKVEVAKRAGADEVILYRREDFVARTLELTGGVGVNVVYDAVGKDTFEGSLTCLDYEGKLVNYGQASGPVEPFAPGLLAGKSLSIARPIIFHYLRTPDRLRALAAEAFHAMVSGTIAPLDPVRMKLEDAAEAHRMMEAQKSPGAIILEP